MASASSNQSYVRDGAGYDEMYSSGHKDPNVSSEERSPSASSSVASSPYGSMINEWKNPWGDDSIRPSEQHPNLDKLA